MTRKINQNESTNLAESEALWGRRGEAKLEGGGQDDGEGGENTWYFDNILIIFFNLF